MNVYSSIFDGGFRRSLKVEDGATLELSHILASLQNEGQQQVQQQEPQQQPVSSSTDTTAAAAPGEAASTDATRGATSQDISSSNAFKRLSALTFKRRHQRSYVSGPPLRVVDVDAMSEPTTLDKQKNDVNVRVSITLEALDEEGTLNSLQSS